MTRSISWRIVVFALLVSGCTEPQSQTNLQAERQALLAADSTWAAAAAAGNVEKVKTFWAEDAVNIFPGRPPASGMQEIGALVARNRSIPGFSLTWQPEEAAVASSGDLGYTMGPYTMGMQDSTGASITKTGHYVAIWEKSESGAWKVIVEITTPGPGSL